MKLTGKILDLVSFSRINNCQTCNYNRGHYNLKNVHAKRKFFESFFLNSPNNNSNDRDSVAFPQVYQNLFVPALHEKLHRSVVNLVSGFAMTC